MLTPKAYINIVAGVLCLLLIGAGAYGVHSYKTMAAKVATIAPLEKKIEDLAAQQKTLSEEVIRRDEFDTAIRASSQTVHIKLDKASNEDPAAREYLDERIPDAVREAFIP
jgi:outer membrane scaffolding protein for murein synthesis (MipA/OmpV family)